MLWFYLSEIILFNSALIYLHFYFSQLFYLISIIIINISFLTGIFLFLKSSRKTALLQEELKTTRKELSQTLKEVFEYTNILEENNKKIKSLENENIDDQEQINEILSELSIYTNQLESIVNTIDLGICTIDNKNIIQADYNNSFKRIFGEKEYWEKSIFDTVFYNLDDSQKKELLEFFDVAFSNSSTSDSMINAANPVPEFTYIYNEGGDIEEKYISVKISRITNDKKQIEKLMLIFNDVTVQKQMEENLKIKEKKYQSELELLTNIFQYDKDFIISFINDLNERLEKTNKLIESLEISSINEDKLKDIQRIIHSIKGESFSLGFNQLAEICSEMESYIKANVSKTIDTEKNLVLLDYYTRLKEKSEEINNVAKKIFTYAEDGEKLETDKLYVDRQTYNKFKSDFSSIIKSFKEGNLNIDILENYYNDINKLDWIPIEKLEKELHLIIEKTTAIYNKDVELNFMYDINGLPISKYKLLKEVFLHLIRNSISHGIENSVKRDKLGKNKIGKINIHIYEENKNIVIRYSDDGSGLNTESILKKALNNGIISETEAHNLDEEEIINLIFKDGFSTREKGDMVSGTGVGMSIVKNNIQYLLHGNITIKNNPSKGVTFMITFPK